MGSSIEHYLQNTASPASLALPNAINDKMFSPDFTSGRWPSKAVIKCSWFYGIVIRGEQAYLLKTVYLKLTVQRHLGCKGRKAEPSLFGAPRSTGAEGGGTLAPVLWLWHLVHASTQPGRRRRMGEDERATDLGPAAPTTKVASPSSLALLLHAYFVRRRERRSRGRHQHEVVAASKGAGCSIHPQ